MNKYIILCLFISSYVYAGEQHQLPTGKGCKPETFQIDATCQYELADGIFIGECNNRFTPSEACQMETYTQAGIQYRNEKSLEITDCPRDLSIPEILKNKIPCKISANQLKLRQIYQKAD